MKRKFYSTIFLGLLTIGMISAQAQNQECMTNLSIYFEHYKVKNYDAAYEPWKMVYGTCPGLNKANFSAGEKILLHKAEEHVVGQNKQVMLMMLFDLLTKAKNFFPKGNEDGKNIPKIVLILRELQHDF